MNATRTCTIEGCDRRHQARGLCSRHYGAMRDRAMLDGYPSTRARQTTCTVQGCGKKSTGSLCPMHSSRLARTGSLDPRPALTPAERRSRDVARFWAKVDKRGPDECWPWRGTVLDTGYGQFHADGRKHMAHRFSYELTGKPIAPGFEIDHVWARGCTRTDCVNPAHLEPVTPRENKLRSNSATAKNARKQTCRLGHAYRTAPDGSRFCPTCKAEWERNRKRDWTR